MKHISKEMEANHAQMKEWFEYLHRNPELSMREDETAQYLADGINQWDYEVETGVGQNSQPYPGPDRRVWMCL